MEAIDRKNPDQKLVEKSYGQVLRKFRQDKGLSQESLGFRSGYHRTYISLLERGLKSPSLQTVFRLAEALEVEPYEMVKHTQDLSHK